MFSKESIIFLLHFYYFILIHLYFYFSISTSSKSLLFLFSFAILYFCRCVIREYVLERFCCVLRYKNIKLLHKTYSYKEISREKYRDKQKNTHDSRCNHKFRLACTPCADADYKERILLGSQQTVDPASASRPDMYCCYHAKPTANKINNSRLNK